jgi:quercetin dioxygenase-like cupin family protein
MMTQYKATFNELPWQLPMAGFRHKIIQVTPMQIRLVEYSKDMEPHWCEKGHLGYVIKGFLEVTFEKEVINYNPGDVLIIPDGRQHRHMGRVIGEKAILLMYEKI